VLGCTNFQDLVDQSHFLLHIFQTVVFAWQVSSILVKTTEKQVKKKTQSENKKRTTNNENEKQKRK
jgi:hypothetical protein